MRILITTESRSTAGGIEKYLQALAPYLVEEGHELGWLFGNTPFSGVGIDAFQGQVKWIAEPTNRQQLRHEICAWKPEMVYAHGLASGSWDRWLSKRYPSIFFAHAFFGACISGSKCHRSPNVATCTRKLGPTCLLLYLPRRCGGRNPIRMLKEYRRERDRQRNLQNFRLVLVASRYMADEYIRQGIEQERIRILPLFPTDCSPVLNCPKPKPWRNCVAMVSRLTELKGAGLVVEAVSIASKRLGRSLQLLVAGDGPGRGSIAIQASKYHVETKLVGWLDSEQRNDFLQRADVLIVPSLWPEPFGLVGIEAGCFGIPSVAFDVGGIPDWLDPGVSGEIASGSPATAQGFGEAIVRALQSREHHEKLSVNAWLKAKRFSLESHLEQLSTILKQAKNPSCEEII